MFFGPPLYIQKGGAERNRDPQGSSVTKDEDTSEIVDELIYVSYEIRRPILFCHAHTINYTSIFYDCIFDKLRSKRPSGIKNSCSSPEAHWVRGLLDYFSFIYKE